MRKIPCPVPKEYLDFLYTERKLTDYEVSNVLNAEGHESSEKRVRTWRHQYGIPTLQRWERLPDPPPIEGPLRSLLIGSMLGDGRVVRRTNSSHYEERHCGAQQDYLEWKAGMWGIGLRETCP